MARQKPKAVTAVDGEAAPVAAPKRKAKGLRKGKARAATDPPAGGSGKKAARKKRLVGAKKTVGQALVAKVFDGLEVALPAVARVRKKPARPGAPLGRLERLEVAVGEVRLGARASLRTRRLLASGIPKMAQKVIEEAAEAAIEAVRGDKAAFVNEAVDLFYNLVVLCSEMGVPLADIHAEMDRRERVLGMAEKLPKAPDP